MLCLPVAGQRCFSNNNPQLHTRCLQRLNELASVKWFQVCHVGRHSSSKSVIARTHLKRVFVNMQKLQVLIAQPDGPKARSNQLLKASRLSSSNFCDGAPSQWLKLTNSDSRKLTNLKSKKIQEQE